jgi:CheY-like chemotaxis protein
VAGDVLREHGYSVVLAGDGQEALLIAERRAGAFDLVVCDVDMPRVNGPALHRALRERGSRVPFLFVSGYAPDDEESYHTMAAPAPMLQKPWARDDLLRGVSRILEAGALAPPRD